MILSHTHEFIFICNGKIGTNSMEALLGPYQEGREFEVGVEGFYTEKHMCESEVEQDRRLEALRTRSARPCKQGVSLSNGSVGIQQFNSWLV
ncbi:hypothetical protein GGP70_003075 [Salinibacter ruber]|nr:hypothetical protein [Salinibacter ruber]